MAMDLVCLCKLFMFYCVFPTQYGMIGVPVRNNRGCGQGTGSRVGVGRETLGDGRGDPGNGA